MSCGWNRTRATTPTRSANGSGGCARWRPERAFDAELLRRHIEYYENNINGYLVGVLTLVRMALERRGPHVGWNMAKPVKMAR